MTSKGRVTSDSNRREATGSLAAQAIIATDWFTLSVDRHRVPALVAEEFASRVRPDERPGALERSPKRRIAEAGGHRLQTRDKRAYTMDFERFDQREPSRVEIYIALR